MINAELYDASRTRIAELLRGSDPGLPVAACPGWTARDLAAHQAGVLADFLAGRFQVEDGDDFGERTVRERGDQDVAASLAEWEGHRAGADDLLAGPMGGVLVAEVVSHEQDLRNALGRPRVSDTAAVHAALERPLQEIERKVSEAGRPALRIVVDGEPRVVGGAGAGGPAVTLDVSAFELLRVVGGRRTRDQVRALDWDGDPEPYLDVFTLFGGFRDTPFDE